MVKNPPANTGDIRDTVQFLVWEDPLEKGVAATSNILVWRIPWSKEPGRQTTIHKVPQSQIRLKRLSTHAHGYSYLLGQDIMHHLSMPEHLKRCRRCSSTFLAVTLHLQTVEGQS